MSKYPKLKIKIVSLADEARTIRREEQKLEGEDQTRVSLYLHRINEVRPESRSALLAYGYLRGLSYKQMEAKCWVPPDWKRVNKLIQKFGEDMPSNPLVVDFETWRQT